jgi:GNAT superfamily N-acetyltransferase
MYEGPILQVRLAEPDDAAWLKARWPEWLGIRFDEAMDALNAGRSELHPNVLVLCLESMVTRKVCGGLIAGPPWRLIRRALADREEAAAAQVVKLQAVGVDHAYRGLGAGSVLVREAIGAFREVSYRWMYGQFETDRHLTDFYTKLGFTVHPAGVPLIFPEDLGLGYCEVAGFPSEQMFEQTLQPSSARSAN